jgi:hypothetical protein
VASTGHEDVTAGKVIRLESDDQIDAFFADLRDERRPPAAKSRAITDLEKHRQSGSLPVARSTNPFVGVRHPHRAGP